MPTQKQQGSPIEGPQPIGLSDAGRLFASSPCRQLKLTKGASLAQPRMITQKAINLLPARLNTPATVSSEHVRCNVAFWRIASGYGWWVS
jgi:hypothetical protein